MNRSNTYMPRILAHEGGLVNNPNDPGGWTNRGVTIGTLKKLGIDKDGDGDSDLADLKLLTAADAAKVFKRFYADHVQADLLPIGLDYAMTDFAVNSGPTRAAEHLQRILGVAVDGHIGPQTLAKVAQCDAKALIVALSESRLRFLRNLKTWGTFGAGWQRRVFEVQAAALNDADGATKPAPIKSLPPKPPATAPQPAQAPTTAEPPKPLWAWLLAAVRAWIKPKGPKA